MLCRINIKPTLTSNPGTDYLFDVPDELFMYHMAMYGDFRPEQLSDMELQQCRVLGIRSTLKYVGPAETPTNNRKEKK